jgi:hypothetical protein
MYIIVAQIMFHFKRNEGRNAKYILVNMNSISRSGLSDVLRRILRMCSGSALKEETKFVPCVYLQVNVYLINLKVQL